ncbi:DUF4397 domain-containing protein [Gillisia sp. M10.2A]|uniref:DUF4397 domain-containing protein n=1 Tax=Gillisia lutea TaxID=2909668 RepID=A0ABS9ECL6_9FLAO|nr:DUF4397 domain-containing protein [Gillisia lutea]MCF4100613.1 DUF4397 domain-containing protein [Gillisia lutea]
MRKTFNKILILFAVSLLFNACEENAIPELTEPVSEEATYVKFFFHVENAPSVNFYFDDQKVSAVGSSSADEVQGNSYGSVFPSNAYALIPSGDFNVNARDLEGNVIASTNASFAADKNYSAYLVGTTDSYEVFVMEDQLPPSDRVKIFWRFVNTMANMPFSVDVYAIKAAVPETDDSPAQAVQVISLGNGLAFKQGGDYTELEPGNYTFKVFESGSDYDPETSTPYIQNTVNVASKGRVYSTQIRGTYAESPSSKNIDYWRER